MSEKLWNIFCADNGKVKILLKDGSIFERVISCPMTITGFKTKKEADKALKALEKFIQTLTPSSSEERKKE